MLKQKLAQMSQDESALRLQMKSQDSELRVREAALENGDLDAREEGFE